MTASLSRLYQLAAAAVAAGLLALVGAADPIEEMIWIALYRLEDKPVSGQIVIVDVDQSADPTLSVAQRQAEVVRQLSRHRPRGIYLQGNYSADDRGIAELGAAIDATDVPVAIGWVEGVGSTRGLPSLSRSSQLDGAVATVDRYHATALGFAWESLTSFDVGNREMPGFPAAVAGFVDLNDYYFIDYRYANSEITIFPARVLSRSNLPLTGKRVLVGSASSGSLLDQGVVPIPGDMVPRIQLAFFAAESLLQGVPVAVGWLFALAIIVAIVFAAVYYPPAIRRTLYAVAVAACLAIPFFGLLLDRIVESGATVVFLVLFAILRITSLLKAQAAKTDHLSGLRNFSALAEKLEREDGMVIVARVNRFEEVLSSLEPEFHGEFMQQIAERLAADRFREIFSDGAGNFAWLDGTRDARGRMADLIGLTGAPILVENRTFDFTCSFGIQDVPIDSAQQAISATLVAAELASTRMSHIALVSERESTDANWRLSLHTSLDHAIVNGHIYLVYQPQVMIENGQIVGAEALVRWKHPERGEISPFEFIPQIEKAGRLKPLTAHTFRMAARTASLLPERDLRISVNVSATLVCDDNFVQFVQDNVMAGGGSASRIMLEITETARIENLELAARHLTELREAGFKVSLDDFGTGEANLSLLVHLPCDEVKLDQTFVRLAKTNERARMIIIALAQTTRLSNMSFVAEGIETVEDQAIMASHDCKVGQGYLYGYPLPSHELIEIARKNIRLVG
ncbi:EAL domain-containing protein [uncultured Croceicoccus sp.]|uniref:EAL domain-containing protein n=1 Tax=uncultured Croceicoccus sp. TaxID=1295329 RepID=UPI00262C003A|nr:EAL domain-containing protein [uncultured Croceicoccus sp.]